ncbi:MAG: hypothetical protein K5681_05430 [Treponema sp.]|nr:hypothetical protein [Treponema sp.]
MYKKYCSLDESKRWIHPKNTYNFRRLIMAFFKSNKIKVKYLEKLEPTGYRLVKRSVKPEELDVLKNNPDIRNLELINNI